MNSLFSVLVAAIVGIVLAVATTVGIVSVGKSTPDNTDPIQKPLIQYGHTK